MRDQIIRIRASHQEVATMKDLATAWGLTLSELVRRSALGARMPVLRLNHTDAAVLGRTLGELGRIGGNLNQITRQVNAGRLHGHDAELSRTLADVDALRGRIREIIA
ncbi:plasmid mobilization relaxosome protein MobC [Agrobacterium sp. FDAARGOS_525]|uniref:plasmid mobilization protein n=1 Tax=Agrobacterium sp. FDAARGOS_525 TaxID=2420311 RepID=UPI000F689A32|nr:plasmid mobilization relaxosome protein MobC [Agrobacterium sp. FDAARGOS_525]RSC31180.1 plasmid mobilization relaxosome protein MobC [Agrobacterium sp. FDAARGOS_525]